MIAVEEHGISTRPLKPRVIERIKAECRLTLFLNRQLFFLLRQNFGRQGERPNNTEKSLVASLRLIETSPHLRVALASFANSGDESASLAAPFC